MGLGGRLPVCKGGSIEVRPGVVRRVDLRNRHVQTENDAQVEFLGGRQCILKLKAISQKDAGESDE